MKKKKMIYSILLVLLIGIVLFFYNAFNGNPISKVYSKKVLENYLSDTYTNKEFRIKDGFYDFKFSEYIFEVIEIGNATEDGPAKYEFSVSGFIKPIVTTDGIYYANLDEDLMMKLGQEASREIESILREKVASVKGVDIQLELLKGKLDSATKWNKDLPLEKPLQMHIVIDSTNQTKEDVLNDTKKIQTVLDSEGYVYDYATINGNGFDQEHGDGKDERGYVKYSISFDKGVTPQLKDVEEFDQ